MGNPSPARRPSIIVNRTVTPRRPRNADLREREYLTPKEVDRLQDAARKHSRYGHRDATAILIAYRHGLRASELCELTWNMIELDSGRIHLWHEIIRTGSHPIEVYKCERAAKDRLLDIKQDDIDELMSFRIAGKKRVWCIKDRNIMRVLWWDPDHQVCPAHLKNT